MQQEEQWQAPCVTVGPSVVAVVGGHVDSMAGGHVDCVMGGQLPPPATTRPSTVGGHDEIPSAGNVGIAVVVGEVAISLEQIFNGCMHSPSP
jgi:hypothetical protein